MRDIDKLRRAKRTIQVQSETLDEYRNTIKFLEAKVFRLEKELSKLHKYVVVGMFCKECNNWKMSQDDKEPICKCNTESETDR